jgi:two-component system KDP operon response regulator KdpE
VLVAERTVKLTPREYDLLRVLVTHAGKVLTHKQLLREAWGPGYANDIQYLRVYIGQLREKIEADPAEPRHIVTEAGVGYRLQDLGA